MLQLFCYVYILMRKACFITLFTLFAASGLYAQIPDDGIRHRILVLMNGSVKMRAKWSEKENNYQVASRVINAVIDSLYQINEEVEFGLRVYGHQHRLGERDCYDTKKEVMFSRDTRTQMALRLSDIRPQGLAPMGFALSEAANYDIIPAPLYAYSIIIVTDGSMDCNDDICTQVAELKKRLKFRPYILHIGDDEQFRSGHGCLGEFLPVKSEENIKYAVGHIVETYRKILPPKKPGTAAAKKKQLEEPTFPKAAAPKPKPLAETAKEEKIAFDTLKTGRVATAVAEPAVVISKNSRIKTGEKKKGGAVRLLNISHINHIAIVPIDTPKAKPKDIFPVGLDIQHVALGQGRYRLGYYNYGRQIYMDFRIDDGDTTEVWLAR
jgi:hypothetical protein